MAKNIDCNKDYQSLEFIILDYNSKDNLEEYIKSNFSAYIKSGKLVYYKTCSPTYFHRSHSRNLLFRLGTGRILCNIDADNYTGKNFAFFVNTVFSKKENVFIASGVSNKNVLGRICLEKKDFYEVSGYDESMSDYGFEDIDLINRLQLKGLQKRLITNHRYLKSIDHSDRERIINEAASNKLTSVLVHYINYYSSELILLFNTGDFERGTIVENKALNASNVFNELNQSVVEHDFSLKETAWLKGRWEIMGNDLFLLFEKELLAAKNLDNGKRYLIGDKVFYAIRNDPSMNEEAIFFYSQIKNRIKMEENRSNSLIRVNFKFGEDIVFKNFDYENPILINGSWNC